MAQRVLQRQAINQGEDAGNDVLRKNVAGESAIRQAIQSRRERTSGGGGVLRRDMVESGEDRAHLLGGHGAVCA